MKTAKNARLILIILFSCLVTATVSAAFETGQAPSKKMTTIQASVLGIVEGLTEYLPVSSTGHLLLAKDLLGMTLQDAEAEGASTATDAINAYLVCIQFGAILAILFVCAHRFKKIVRGLFNQDAEGRQLLIHLALALSPAIVIGLILEAPIKRYLFGILPVIVAWFVGGGIILLISYYFRFRQRDPHQGMEIEEIGPKIALLIGLAQCLAMWPGVSRSLTTILGGLFLGLSMKATVEFSFLLGAVTLTAATVYDVLKHGNDMLAVLDIRAMALGLFFAFIAATASVKWMIAYLNKYGLEIFGYYRIVLAAAAWFFYGGYFTPK